VLLVDANTDGPTDAVFLPDTDFKAWNNNVLRNIGFLWHVTV